MKKLMYFLALCSTSFIYSQAAVIDVAAQKQLTALNSSNKTALGKLAEQVGTAAKQLSQLEKTYETVKSTAEKIEKVNDAVQSYSNLSKYISKQAQIVKNLQEVTNYRKHPVNPALIKKVLNSTSASLLKIQNILTDKLFNMTDAERMQLLDKENEKMQINLLRSKMYLNSIK